MTIQEWIDRRVGSGGKGRSLITSHLLLVLPPAPNESLTASRQVTPLGLTESQVAQLARAYRFAELAQHFPSRGDVQHLCKVAWYGSAVADIAVARAAPERELALRDGALFNVGIALFDTIVDDQPDGLAGAQEALYPAALRQRLMRPRDRQTVLM